MKLVLKVPDKETPGFFRRLAKATKFQEQIKSEGVSSELVNSMVDFLADYVEAESKETAKELLWDCTENQFNELMVAISGGGKAEEVVPPQ